MISMSGGLCWEDVLKDAAALLRGRAACVSERLERCRIEARLCAISYGYETYTVVLVADREDDVDYLYDRGGLLQEALNEVLAARGCLCTDLLVRLPAPEGPEHLLDGVRRLVAESRDSG